MFDKRPIDYTMELGPMGPIGEGAALMLRVNRNCPWNQCLFCPVYKGQKFSARRVEEIKQDIEVARRVSDLLEKVSWDMGLNGWIHQEVIQSVVRGYPEIYGEYPSRVTPEQWLALQGLRNVANWLAQGSRSVFLQDANALLEKGRIALGLEQRRPIVARVVGILWEDLPGWYTIQGVVEVALRGQLKGFRKGFAWRPAWVGGGFIYFWLGK